MCKYELIQNTRIIYGTWKLVLIYPNNYFKDLIFSGNDFFSLVENMV